MVDQIPAIALLAPVYHWIDVKRLPKVDWHIRTFWAYSWGVDGRDVKSVAFFKVLIAITLIVAAALQ
jgi:hypothetical protein